MNDFIPNKPLHTAEFDSLYSIVSLRFENPCRCELYDGGTTITMPICDELFNSNVEDGFIRFTKGDLLHCRVKLTQWKDKSELRATHEVIKVKKYIHRSGRPSTLIDEHELTINRLKALLKIYKDRKHILKRKYGYKRYCRSLLEDG